MSEDQEGEFRASQLRIRVHMDQGGAMLSARQIKGQQRTEATGQQKQGLLTNGGADRGCCGKPRRSAR